MNQQNSPFSPAVVDAAAGLRDALLPGRGGYLRDAIGIDGRVDPCNDAYKYALDPILTPSTPSGTGCASNDQRIVNRQRCSDVSFLRIGKVEKLAPCNRRGRRDANPSSLHRKPTGFLEPWTVPYRQAHITRSPPGLVVLKNEESPRLR